MLTAAAYQLGHLVNSEGADLYAKIVTIYEILPPVLFSPFLFSQTTFMRRFGQLQGLLKKN